MKLTKNFNLSEFNCNDGAAVPEELIKNVELLALNLQVLRDAIGEPITLNSAYRNPSYNQKVGGSSKSQHLLAKAGDIKATNKFPAKIIYQLIEELIAKGDMQEGGLGLYNNFVHYDVRKNKSRW